MELIAEQNILKKLYSDIEVMEELNEFPICTLPTLDNISDDLRLKICIEYNAHLSLDADHIQKNFGTIKEEVKSYLEERKSKTSNLFLRARYNHFLYVLIKNNKYGEQAINMYQQILPQYINNPESGYNILHFQDILEFIICITESTKYNIQRLTQQIHNYLQDSDIHCRLKTRIIQSIKVSKLFKAAEFDYIPSLCCDLAKIETEPNFIEIDLQLGLDFARKLVDVDMQKTINELLGDNEYLNIRPYDGKIENLLIPHYNSNSYKKIIHYYRHAKNKEKLDKALIEYNENKRNCKIPKISVPIRRENIEELQQLLNSFFLGIINSSTDLIVLELIFGNNLLFIPDDYIEKYVEESKNNYTLKFFKPIRIDINSNEKEIEEKEFLRFQFYSTTLSRTIEFTFDIIMACIENRKLSYNKIANVLNKMPFGQELIVQRNEKSLTYTWLSLVDIGIQSFFEQCKLLQKGKQPDWRFSIEFLSLKFEGILRDIVKELGGAITDMDEQKNTTNVLIDKLLGSPEIKRVFSKDDINLFQYTLTSKGYNIRNNVAHSFYKPQDYNAGNAVLVLLCILRLAKFQLPRPNDPTYEK